MLLIGLTGSIATGKSTVSTLLSQPPYSLPIIDADIIARQVVEPGTAGYAAILAHFGPTTPDLLLPEESSSTTTATCTPPVGNLSPKGRPLDRAALGRRVFGSSPSRVRDRAVLNSIVHPAVRRAMALAMLRHYGAGQRAVVLDVPLLFESGLDVFCGVVVVVGVRDPAVQLGRLLARDREKGGSLTEREARERVESQGGVEGKVERVRARGEGWGEVVWNDGGREALRGELDRVMRGVKAGSPDWWGTLLWLCPPLAATVAAWGLWNGVRARRAYEGGAGKKGERARL